MNKRIRKKKFKQKYGISQDQAINTICGAVDAVLQFLKNFPRACVDLTDSQFQAIMENQEISEEAKAYVCLFRLTGRKDYV